MAKFMKILTAVTVVIALSACSGQEVKDDTTATTDDQSGGTGTSTTGVTTTGVDRLGEINGIPIGNGRPGPVFREMIEAWSALVGVDISQQIVGSST